MTRRAASRPLIGILGRNAATAENFSFPAVAGGRLYADAVVRAGGAPVIVPPTTDEGLLAASLGRLDGLVLPGGGDIDPARYGQRPHETVYNVDAALDDFEFAAVCHVAESAMPALAVCRGMQVLNVALGGDLIQHMDGHRNVDHDVEIAADSRSAAVVAGRRCTGRSFHHQAIGRLADSLVEVGRSADATIEAVEHRDHPWLVGVQWHPELTAAADPCQQGFFDELVRRAR